MLLSEIVSILDAEPLNGEMDLGIDIQSAFASDLMSDVLALARPGVLMITGLTNIQIMRTASMIDIPAVVFVRGKKPPRETIELAGKLGIPFIITYKTMFETCGMLFQAGVKPILCAKR
jgi:predicted transcriptional regulator